MKKGLKLIVIFVLSIMFAGTTKVYAETPTLEQIVNTFNNSSAVEKYHTDTGGSLNAAIGENNSSIDVTSTTADTPELSGAIVKYNYPLEGSILSADIQLDSDSSNHELFVWELLVDSIGQLYGYEEGELLELLEKDEISDYTLSTEGYEYGEKENGHYAFKIDLSKKVPLEKVVTTTNKPTTSANNTKKTTNVKVPNTAEDTSVKIIIMGYIFVLIGSISVFYILTKKTLKQEQ